MDIINVNNISYIVFVDGEIISKQEALKCFLPQDLEVVQDEKILIRIGKEYKIVFVGTFITPNKNYISLPKSMEKTEENVNITKKIMNKFIEKKAPDHKHLGENRSFIPDKEGKFDSDIYYYKTLKKYFLDRFNFNFIYPEKRIQKFSNYPIEGEIDFMESELHRLEKGEGWVYDVIDTELEDESHKNWNLGNIYYTTLLSLAEIYGTDNEIKKIKDRKDSLLKQGFKIKEDNRVKQKTQIQDIIKDIEKCKVDSTYIIIKKRLLNYFKDLNIGTRYNMNIFYTRRFEYVWEYLCKYAFEVNDDFREKMKPLTDKGLSISEEGEKPIRAEIDIFSDYEGYKFIGDAKYYKKTDDKFFKEWAFYNITINNKYPSVIFIPGVETKCIHVKKTTLDIYTKAKHKKVQKSIPITFKLIVLYLSLRDVAMDLINNTSKTIDKVQKIIQSKENELKNSENLEKVQRIKKLQLDNK